MWGVGVANLRRYQDSEVRVIRVKNASSDEHVKAALLASTKCNLRYDYLQLLWIALGTIFGPSWLLQCLNRRKRYICSEVYYDGWLMVGYVLCPGKDLSMITPGDIADSPLVETVA